MEVRLNPGTEEIIYLRGWTREEKKVLEDMWKHGVKAFAFGTNSELGICSKKFFGSWSKDSQGLSEKETKQ